MKIPPYLKKGDIIGIAAPARKVSRQEMELPFAMLEKAGFRIKPSPNLFGAYHQFSGTDAERISDVQHLLDDRDVKAIIAARGGYGTLRLIDGLDFRNFKKNPKWICGFSDITVFHSFINQQCRVETIHSTMPINFAKDEESFLSLVLALTGDLKNHVFPVPHLLNIPGKTRAVLTGGNLSLLYAMAGGPGDSELDKNILFLEDLDEYLYHIDRMMVHLKRAGKLSGLKGMLVGGMDDMKDNLIPFGKNALEIIREHAEEFNFPVGFNFPSGHGNKNLALYLGREVGFEVDDHGIRLDF